ncbi:uncharacterized protein CTRU02_207459 [Colletotrichum truncatum]|uniref:Uncharacterized protein n=1 Tax=Colletotrichum truncatum TaxID=5467 RepID=A0ACC3Z0X0_COLTU|nr:uncharacterized protein CTRU02_00906 [Colletotrichum truncatum]KAF6800501.1 hypothetical protein CTRU02_00906 [Colletotrichum truncatum]
MVRGRGGPSSAMMEAGIRHRPCCATMHLERINHHRTWLC